MQLGSYTEHARSNEDQNLQEVLSLFPKLAERKKQIVRTMSGGEQQMVAIGRALMSAPTILMLDEPSLGLSPLLCKELFSSLKKVRDSGVGILLVEQNAKQSLSISDRGYLLGNGKILGHDNAENLLNASTVQAAYLGGAMASPKKAAPKITVNTQTTEVTDKTSDAAEPALSSMRITPGSTRHATHTVSSDSLLDENIDALVARAGSSASQPREPDASLPVQVVKLTSQKAAPAPSTPRTAPAIGSAAGLDLPETQDTEVQALLADFEAAARRAAGASSTTTTAESHNGSSRAHRSHDDDSVPLPHIPVYKKSHVKVYKRDGSGKLRKQE